MKNKIEYYYRIENINLHEQNNIYNFLYNNKKYIFFNTTRNIKEIERLRAEVKRLQNKAISA